MDLHVSPILIPNNDEKQSLVGELLGTFVFLAEY